MSQVKAIHYRHYECTYPTIILSFSLVINAFYAHVTLTLSWFWSPISCLHVHDLSQKCWKKAELLHLALQVWNQRNLHFSWTSEQLFPPSTAMCGICGRMSRHYNSYNCCYNSGTLYYRILLILGHVNKVISLWKQANTCPALQNCFQPWAWNQSNFFVKTSEYMPSITELFLT